MHPGNFPGSAKRRWLDFFFFGKSQARTAPLSQYKGLSFLFRELSRIFIR